jgi:hypothetical protein
MSEIQGLNTDVDSATVEHPATDGTTSDQAMAGSASPSDDASSLRAKALLSLKRRKPAADHPISTSQRPVPRAFVLNYGEEESTPPTAAPPSAIAKAVISPEKTVAPQVEDNREEGEISDTENTTPTVPKPKASTKKASRSKAAPTDTKLNMKTSPILAKLSAPAKPPAPQEHQTDVTSALAGPLKSISPSFTTTQPHTAPYTLDADHVRPGLSCSLLTSALLVLPDFLFDSKRKAV